MKQNPRRLGRRALVLAAFAATALAALPTAAGAAPAGGKVKLTFKAKTKSSLLRQEVRVDGGKGRTQATELGVKRAWDGGPERIRAAGTIVFSSGKRQAKLRAVQVTIRGRHALISAKLGKQRAPFFRAKGAHRGGESWFQLKSGKLTLTGKGARLLRQRLDLAGGLAGRVGSLVARAKLDSTPIPLPIATPPAVTPAPAPTPPTPEPEPEKEAYPYQAQCSVPGVEGGEGFADAPGEVEGIAPAPTFAAGTSQPVTGTTVDWGFKDSFRFYVANVGGGGSLLGVEGAGANPTTVPPFGTNMGNAGAFFDFPVASGSYEPGTEPDHSDDLLVASGGGASLFCKPGHGFNVVFKNPTVTIDGEDSRITADVGVNLNGTWYPFQRADIATLDIEGIEPTIGDGGNTVTWEGVPATFTADGAIASGIYEAGEPLDPITVSASLDRPLLAQCTIDAGTVEPEPLVEFPTLSLPELSAAESGGGGTINWGFRPSLRASVAAAGSFQLLGGAEEGFPGAMGGSSSKPVSEGGGQGKFFRFPVAEWTWEEGEAADPGDDRLIATSEATVGFCNPVAGNYGVVISKPTLVIDGGDTRLVANAYSYSGGFPTPTPKGWIGGRVDLVALSATGVEAENAGDTVSWGNIPADGEPVVEGLAAEGGFLTNALAQGGAVYEEGGGEGGFDLLSAQIELTP